MTQIISSPYIFRAYLMETNTDEMLKLYGMLIQTDKVEVVGMTNDPQVALIEVNELQPDFLFLDLELPTLEGVIVVEQVKKQFPLIQIVVLTENKDYGIWAFEQQIADYILKPLVKKRLENTLGKLMLRYYDNQPLC